MNGGMYEGSEVHLTADGTSSYTVFDEISKSQAAYLKADKGSGRSSDCVSRSKRSRKRQLS